MKKEFTHIERKGLPGGPNEMFTYVTGVFSTEGYKRNSPDVSNPFNIIPSGSITMKDVDFPVMGTDNLGNSEMMMPGNDYQFPGDQVFEVPMAKKGGGLLTKTMKCNSCGWSWKAADGGKDVSTCHKCGGSALPKAQEGREQSRGETRRTAPSANTLSNTLHNVLDYFTPIDNSNPNRVESPHKPTVSTDPNAKYYTYNGLKNDVIKNLAGGNNIKTINTAIESIKKQAPTEADFVNNYGVGSDTRVSPNFNSLYNYYKNATRNTGAQMGSINLGAYSVGAGEDDKGRYISIYDKYDWDVMGDVKPKGWEIYDRIYEDEFKVNSIAERAAKRKTIPLNNVYQDGGSALSKAQDGGDIDNTYYTNDPNDPRRYSYSDSAYLHDYSTAENKWYMDQQKFGEVIDGFITMPTGIINSSDFDQWYKDNDVFEFGNPFTADKVSNNAPSIVTDYNKIDPNSEYNNDDWSTGSNYNKDYLETSRNAPIPPESHTTYGKWWASHPDIIKYIQEFKLGYDATTGKYISPSRGKDKSRERKVGLLEQVNEMLSNSMPTELQWVKPKSNSQSSKTTTTTSKGNTNDFEWSANAYVEFLKGMPKSVKGKPDHSHAIPNFPAPRGSKPLEYGIVRPFVETESLDRKEYNPTLSKNLNIENVPEIKVNPSKELPYYQRTGFNSGLQRIQPSNYDPNNTTLREEPFQMDMQGNIYQSGGSLPKAQDGNGEYTVESGNTFDGIANKLGINKQTLRQVNPGINYNELQVGQTIKYPAQKPEPTSWGDYMNPMNWGVSNRDDDGDFKQAFRTAREAGEDEFMWYGTRYSTDLKKTANKSQVQVEKTSDKLEPAKETKPPEGKTEKYTVKSGDTFNGIVNKKEVSKYFLKKVNPNVDYGNLNVGQVINLPDKKKDTLGVDEIENYLTITNGQTPDFWKSTADTIAFHESGPWQPMDPEAIQKSQNKKTGNFFEGPGEGVFQIETERAGGKNSFKQFKNRYESVADKLNMYADPKIINASRPIDLSLEEQYALFYTNLMEEPNVILKDYAQGDMSLIDLWLAGHKKVEKPGDRDAFRTSVERLKEEKTIFKKSGGEVDEFQVYANYINGSYNGTEMETKAEKIYDKLNRVYYRKAKALDMSAPNYIMSNIINRSGQ